MPEVWSVSVPTPWPTTERRDSIPPVSAVPFGPTDLTLGPPSVLGSGDEGAFEAMSDFANRAVCRVEGFQPVAELA